MISIRKLLRIISAAAIVIIAVIAITYLNGFNLTIQINQRSEQNSENIAANTEQNKREIEYRERLTKLQGMLETTEKDIEQLKEFKKQFIGKDNSSVMPEKHFSNKSEHKAETHITLPSSENHNDSTEQFVNFHNQVERLSKDWRSQLNWLNILPTGLPISGEFRVTSGFGMRKDSSSNKLLPHIGIDFEVASTTPVIAAAEGTVSKVSKEKSYGNFIEITHAEGFMTRYARVRNISVEEGQRVERSQQIAQVGRNGMPIEHLHYEVYRHGRLINPIQVLPLGNN